jgi:hypothetical protein
MHACSEAARLWALESVDGNRLDWFLRDPDALAAQGGTEPAIRYCPWCGERLPSRRSPPVIRGSR